MAVTCSSCGTVNPDVARFCMACGHGLTGVGVEEVRQVTVVFADLVGFTERSDRADPEDVRGTLIPFHRAAKTVIEEHGGTLDKFIGDAAMGIFGAPTAHDDDPERAVRAGLALLDRIDEIARSVDPDASIRVAIETGDAVVAFGTGPQVGEAVAGDVVNTASRMQSLAPPGRLVVGERTWQAVRERFHGEPMAPVAVKGKSEPVRCYLIGAARTEHADPIPLLGRDADLERLGSAFALAREAGADAVTIVAPPGLGKTRLVRAFLDRLAGSATTYTIGFSPRGDDSTFGPFADLVADVADAPRHADPAVIDAAIERLVLGPSMAEADRASLRRRLRMIMGADASTGTIESPRDIADAIAHVLLARDPGPTAIVVEDTHWAGPAARAVLTHLRTALESAPVLLVCTARPEIHTDDAGVLGEDWELSPLDATATRAVLAAASGMDLAGDAVAAVADRAEGNPLFAIEFGRTIGETAGGTAVPTSVRAVISARLDSLPEAPRDLLLDAAVVGATFWPGALAAIDHDRDPSVMLDDLVRRGMVTASDTSRLAGEPAFGFTHALIRDEAYARLPRAARARRHLAVGDWLASAAGEAAPSFAASLANHFGEAIRAARSAGVTDVAEAATPRAIEWLITAAEQVFRLDGEGAFAMFERALELGASGVAAERAWYGSAVVGRRIGSLPGPEVLDRYRLALASARERGDLQAEGLQLVRVGSQLAAMGRSTEALGCFDAAIDLLEREAPGLGLAAALTYRAEEDMFAGRAGASLELVERALPIAREGGFSDLVIMGLHLRGDARCDTGDLGGLADLEEALELARRDSGLAEVATSLAYIGEWRWQLEGPAAGAAVFEEGVRITQRAGIASQGMWSKAHLLLVATELGEWDRSIALAGELLAMGTDMLDASLDVVARAHRSAILLRRGEIDTVDDPADVLTTAESSHELQSQAPAFAYAAEHAAATGDIDGVRAAIERFAAVTEDAVPVYRAGEAPTVVRLAIGIGDVGLAERFVTPLGGVHAMRQRLHLDAARAAIAEARGTPDAGERYRDVAVRWRRYGHPWEEAHALRGLARTTADAEAGGRADDLLRGLGVPASRTEG